MSKTSRFFLWVIVVGLAFIAGLRFYRAYEQRAEEEAATAAPTMTFNNVPVQRVSPQAEPQVYERWSGEPAVQEVYLQDAPLDAVQEKEQARQTVASVLSDYKDNPSLQAFYADLRAATGRDDIDLAALSGEAWGACLSSTRSCSKSLPNMQGPAVCPGFAGNFFQSPVCPQRGHIAGRSCRTGSNTGAGTVKFAML